MTRHERLTRLAVTLVATALVAACTATTTPPSKTDVTQASPSAKPAATAAAAPTASQQPMEIIGKFALQPAHGPWDTPVTATASGLKPATQYDVMWATAKGAWKLSEDRSRYVGRAYTPVQVPLQKVTT